MFRCKSDDLNLLFASTFYFCQSSTPPILKNDWFFTFTRLRSQKLSSFWFELQTVAIYFKSYIEFPEMSIVKSNIKFLFQLRFLTKIKKNILTWKSIVCPFIMTKKITKIDKYSWESFRGIGLKSLQWTHIHTVFWSDRAQTRLDKTTMSCRFVKC